MLSRQFKVFLVCGAVAALANILSRVVFSSFFSFEKSVTLAFFVGLVTGFLLMRSFAFESSASIGMQFLKFLFVNGLSLVQTYFISVYMLKGFMILDIDEYNSELLAHIFGVGVPILSSYLAHKYWTFKVINKKYSRNFK